MPIRLKRNIAPPPPEGPGLLRRLLAGGLRVGGGVLSSPGGAFGATVGAGSELAAQAAEEAFTKEGYTPDLKRVAIEAGLSSIPFSKVVKGGKLLRDALVSGAMTGSGEALRQGYAGEDSGWLPDEEKIDPKSVGVATLLGMLTGGIGSALYKPRPAGPSGAVVETTAQPGGQVLGGAKGGLVTTPPTRTIRPEGKRPPTLGAPQPRYTQPAPATGNPLEDWLAEARRRAGLEAPVQPEGPSLPPAWRGRPRQQSLDFETAAPEALLPKAPVQIAGLDFGDITTLGARGGARWTPERIEELAQRYEQAGRDDVAAQIREAGGAGRVPYSAAEPAPYRTAARAAQKAEDLAAENARRVAEIERMKAEAGLQPQEPTVTETLEGLADGGVRMRGTRRYVPSQAAEGEREIPGQVVVSSERLPEPATAPLSAAESASTVEALAQQAGNDPAALLKFLRPTEVVDLVGENYRFLKAAQEEPEFFEKLRKTGGLPQDVRGRELTPTRMAGMELQRRAQAAGLPTGAAARLPKAEMPVIGSAAPPTVPEARVAPAGEPTGMTPETLRQLEETTQLAGKLKELGVSGPRDLGESIGLIERLRALNKPKGGTSAGFLGITPDIIQAARNNPELAAQLLSGSVGAGIGAATSDNPLAGAGLGFAGGFVAPKAIPAALRAIGAPVEAVRASEFNLSSPEGIKKAVDQIFTALPQVQRFNLLADVTGLPANALVGPWGSAVMGALEHALAGDPRGLAALQELRNPVNFVRQLKQNSEEAWQRLRMGDVGRGEQGLLQKLPEQVQKRSVAAPGWFMTTGDITARRILTRAGFTEDEAKIMTLTSEPVGKTFRSIAEAGKGSPILQLLFPFRRTPANIAQQGLQRMPVIGSFMDQQIPLQQQLIAQYGITPAVAGASYVAGENLDPETAKIARRYISNLGGQYSLAAGLGFTAGQAQRAGKPLTAFQKQRMLEQALPLPTVEPLLELGNFLFGGGKLPRGMRPQFLEDLGVIEKPGTIRVRRP